VAVGHAGESRARPAGGLRQAVTVTVTVAPSLTVTVAAVTSRSVAVDLRLET
jgi:hypothetical protein